MTGRNPSFEWRDAFSRAGYRGAPLAVGIWIGSRWNGDRYHPIAPVETLMSETKYSRRAVTMALARLREDGWIAQITKGGRRGDGTTWSSRYRLTVPALNVQSSASQCAKDCTPVDQKVDQRDQTPSPPVGPTSSREVGPTASLSEVDQERAKMKWLNCPDHPWHIPWEVREKVCHVCALNDACPASLRRAGLGAEA